MTSAYANEINWVNDYITLGRVARRMKHRVRVRLDAVYIATDGVRGSCVRQSVGLDSDMQITRQTLLGHKAFTRAQIPPKGILQL